MPLSTIKRFRRCERGSTAIEYALIGAIVVLGMMSGLVALGDTERGAWGSLGDEIVRGFNGTVQ